MNLAQWTDANRIVVPTRSVEKLDVIRELVECLARSGHVSDASAAAEAVFAREKMRSTGIGNGLAIPHAKSDACRALTVALGKPPHPIDFQSNDDRPCELVVLLISPPHETGAHVQALARVSRLWMRDAFRHSVRNAHDAQTLYQAICDHE